MAVLLMLAFWLIAVWIGYRWVRSAYKVKKHDLLGDILSLLLGLFLGTVLFFIFNACMVLLFF